MLDRLTLNYCTGQSLLPADTCICEVFGMYSVTSEATTDVHLTFTDNTAEVAGSVLYGGQLQTCTIVFGNTPQPIANETALSGDFCHQKSRYHF